ncbi:MAG: hypothetical protein ABI837_20260 [Acidobacteriota bacterium]
MSTHPPGVVALNVDSYAEVPTFAVLVLGTGAHDANAAKDPVRDHARGTERYGLVASSKAMRLKPHAIDVRVDINPVHWFLNDKDDTRFSYYLEAGTARGVGWPSLRRAFSANSSRVSSRA